MTVNLKLLGVQIAGMALVFGAALFLAAGTLAWLIVMSLDARGVE